jgi:hypothetical protein
VLALMILGALAESFGLLMTVPLATIANGAVCDIAAWHHGHCDSVLSIQHGIVKTVEAFSAAE